jgi:hypothetical protein
VQARLTKGDIDWLICVSVNFQCSYYHSLFQAGGAAKEGPLALLKV